MKTRNNYLFIFAVLATFLFAGKTNAKETERKTASSLEMEATEPALELADWMTDENYWVNADEFNEVDDQALELKDWMVSNNFFQDDTFTINEDKDAELDIAPWMVNANLWGEK